MSPAEFIDRWSKSGGAEIANSQSFLKELCALLGVPQPEPTSSDEDQNTYVFEKAVKLSNGDGTFSDGRIDLYVNGTITGGVSYRDYLFLNRGSAFQDATPADVEGLKADHGAQWADVDGDGRVDLALTGSAADGMHRLLRNGAADPDRRAVSVRALDARGRATLAGAELRVYAAGTRRLLGMRLVDSGSGYDAQNDMPTHVGVGDARTVDLELTVPAAGRRRTTAARNVDVTTVKGAVVMKVQKR